MSAAEVLRAALLARLRGDPAVAVNRVIDGAMAKGTVPYVLLRDVAATDWGTKDRAGRELRVGVTVRDAGETGARCATIAAAVEAAIEGVPRDLPGWRVASVALVRSTVLNEGAGDGGARWTALVDFRIRMLAN